MPESKDKGVKIGVSLLLKGGTMLSEVCPSCNGVLIKFQDKIKCINCESELKDIKGATNNDTKTVSINNAHDTRISKNYDEGKEISIDKDKDKHPPALSSAAAIIQDKINLLLKSLVMETDHLILRNKGEVLDLYLNLLSKIVNLKL